MTVAPHVLVVDDEPDIGVLLKDILEEEGYEVTVACNAAKAREARRARRPDLLLLDIWMPDVDGITLLKEWSGPAGPPVPVIMMSGHGTVETAVEATRLGAYDFIEKPLSLAKLLLTIRHALEADRLSRENLGLRTHVRTVHEPLGSSLAMQRLRDQAWRISQHNAWVLITGGPGTGKETLARYIHAKSARRNRPFVVVDASTLARNNSAVELFGSEEDQEVRYGLLEQANGGVLFLDEAADMDPQVQVQLLSALESQRFLRVGGAESVEIDVRVIAATNQELDRAVREGRFREDLYYHINVVPISVPPLREHPEDIPELLEYYVNWYVDHEGLAYRHFSVPAQNRLRNYDWPGNMHELKNLVQRMLILGNGPEIGLDEVEVALDAPVNHRAEARIALHLDQPLREAREGFERAYLEHQLRACGGSVGELAKRAGMERTHLYRKLRALEIDPKNLK